MDGLKRYGVSLRWYGTALIGREGTRRPRPALRTRCRSLRAKRHSQPTVAPRSALPTAFRVVLKLLVVKEKLLSSRKRKFSPAIHTNQISIYKIHDSIPSLRPEPPASHFWNGSFRLPCLQLTTHRCPLEGAV